jgi:hypothetical protein
MKAYKFLKDDYRSGYGNEPPWKEGETRTVAGDIVMCERGYHASPSWLDALQYAPGSIACIVDIKKPVKGDDKWVSNTCTIIKMVDATKVLRTFACDCAERALKLANVTDKRSWNAIKVSRLYNKGKATKEELDTAWDAALAASDAASDAALAAARDAALAASAAALAAARAAARAAASDAERVWQKRHLNKLMKQLFEGK